MLTSNPEPIEETLAEAPVPVGTPREERGDLIRGVSEAATAHLKAIVDLAHDLETQAGWNFEIDI